MRILLPTFLALAVSLPACSFSYSSSRGSGNPGATNGSGYHGKGKPAKQAAVDSGSNSGGGGGGGGGGGSASGSSSSNDSSNDALKPAPKPPAEKTEPVDDLVEGHGDLVLVRDVGSQKNRVLVGEGAFGGSQRIDIEIHDGNRPAVVEQPLHHGHADARGASGDDCRMLHFTLSRMET